MASLTPANVILTVQQLNKVAKWMHGAGCPEIDFSLRDDPPSTEWSMVGKSLTRSLGCTATLMAGRIELPIAFTILALKDTLKGIRKCTSTDLVEFRYSQEDLPQDSCDWPTTHILANPTKTILSLAVRHIISEKSSRLLDIPVQRQFNSHHMYSLNGIKKNLIVFRTSLDKRSGQSAWAAIEKCFIKPARKSERIWFTIEDERLMANWEGGLQQFEIPSIPIGEYDQQQYDGAQEFAYSYRDLKGLFSTIGSRSELFYLAGGLAVQCEDDHMRYFTIIGGERR